MGIRHTVGINILRAIITVIIIGAAWAVTPILFIYWTGSQPSDKILVDTKLIFIFVGTLLILIGLMVVLTLTVLRTGRHVKGLENALLGR